MIVGLATPTLVESDAVGNDVMGMFHTLLENGHTPKLFAVNCLIKEACIPLKNFDGNVDVFIYHHSINCPEGISALNIGNSRKIVKYHNITPPEFFSYNPSIRRECELGLEQNKKIVQYQIWADSDFNGKELKKIKPNLEYSVVSPFTQTDSLIKIEPDYQAVKSINDWKINVLMIGRIAPNKNIILAIETFAIALGKNSHMRLILAGESGGDYGDSVRTKITELKLRDKVIMTGKVSLSHLKALYMISDALLVTSLHEGFCVPLVEAMALNLPIVTGTKGALEETLGNTGITVENYSPENFAMGLEEILRNPAPYRKAGQIRYSTKFHKAYVANSFLDKLMTLK